MFSDQAANVRFTRAKGLFSAGYHAEQVDGFIEEQLLPTLRSYEDGGSEALIRAKDIVHLRFEMARGGYDPAEVDDFLDQAAARLQSWEADPG